MRTSLALSTLAAATVSALLAAPAGAVTDVPAAPASSVAAMSEAPSTGHESVQVRESRDGVTRLTLYTPLPGVPAQQLAAELQRDGLAAEVTGHGDTSGPLGAATPSGQVDSASCWSLGSARSAQHKCFLRWSRAGLAQPKVVMADGSSSIWDVDRAVRLWDQSRHLAVGYRQNCRRLSRGVHCVPISTVNRPGQSWAGQTVWEYGRDGFFRDGPGKRVRIRFNSGPGLTPHQHEVVSCHEVGHAIGLDHNAATSSCLGGYTRSRPNSDDYSMLKRIY